MFLILIFGGVLFHRKELGLLFCMPFKKWINQFFLVWSKSPVLEFFVGNHKNCLVQQHKWDSQCAMLPLVTQNTLNCICVKWIQNKCPHFFVLAAFSQCFSQNLKSETLSISNMIWLGKTQTQLASPEAFELLSSSCITLKVGSNLYHCKHFYMQDTRNPLKTIRSGPTSLINIL